MKWLMTGAAVALVAVACSGATDLTDVFSDSLQPVDDVDAAAPDKSGELDLPVSDEEDSVAIFDLLDVQDVPRNICNEGEGCFLDKCSENTDCQSGFCVEHMGEGVCTQACTEECPPGWSCKQIGSSVPDLVFICVSDYSNLCKPCVASSDCKNVGGADDVCLGYGTEGNFCGGMCGNSQECPWGFTCKETESIDGVALTQCVADTGICPCTGKSVELGLWTPCQVSNDAGICEGMRVCTEDGLSECDAEKPAEETCNGIDDDCDGEVDEPLLVDGKYLELCDDGNTCTLDSCKNKDGCTYDLLTEGECIDGDACTIGDHCENGLCIGLPIDCDDGNICTDDLCDGLGGCTTTQNQAACDDGDPCTVADQCSEEECEGYPVECDCLTDADCQPLEDGNQCNGTLICDQSKLPYQCQVDPATVVDCEADGEPETICLAAYCAPDTGECSSVPAHEGFACDDFDACTIGDKCTAGKCVPGVSLTCADNNICTDDSCHSETGCTFTNNTSVCNDLDICTTGDFCQEGVCAGVKELECNDNNPCTDDMCDPETGCLYPANSGACDDTDPCTIGDHCDAGLCVVTGELGCDDDNSCTEDVCIPGSGCVNSIIISDCDDGDPCTFADICINGFCTSGAPVNCDDKNPCTDDSCNEVGICINSANQAQCDDQNACTVDDHCGAGQCLATQSKACSDGNVCTDDTCDPLDGCLFVVNNAPCDDDDVCTTGDECSQGKCLSPGALTCDDGNICTDDTCHPETGCTFTANTEGCDDGNACTLVDKCAGGWCVAGTALVCDDGDVCTDDICNPEIGCEYTHNIAPCSDGDACTSGEACDGGQCSGGDSINCNDDNICTDDSCVSDTGCVHANNVLTCEDGSKCTENDTCQDGQCIPGPAPDCDDAKVCTDDSCTPDIGCVNANNTADCDDNIGCTVNDKCAAGQCSGVACEVENMVCWQGGCVDHYCGDGTCDNADETIGNCPSDCQPDLWLESPEVEWYPVKYSFDTYKESKAVSTCVAAGLRLWRDESGSANDPGYVYDVYGTHNLGGHDIGYKVNSACGNSQEGHTGTWVIFSGEWSTSIKAASGASNGQNVYILNKQYHDTTYEDSASYTIITPQNGAVSYVSGENAASVTGMQFAIVLCATRK
jgi:hypothetical protein